MSDDPTPSPPAGTPENLSAAPGAPARLGAIVLCLLLAGSAAAHFVGWRQARGGLLETLASAGLDGRDRQAFLRVSRERTPDHARLAAARALVDDVLNLTPEDAGAIAQQRIARLAVARDLARQALRAQPGWEASMLLGATVYLERSLTADPRLFTSHADWEVPMRRAVEETAGRLEPRRLLAAAYLECWPALSEDKKAYARALMQELFRRSPRAFTRLAPAWIEAAPSRAAAFELVPDQPQAWEQLAQIYAGRRDWESFREAHARRLDALERRLGEDLDEVEKRLRLGDLENSRTLCHQVIAGAPASRRFVPLAVRALELYPPGLQSARWLGPFREWRRFALSLDALGLEPLTPRALNRLNDAIGDLRSPEAAHAALIAGDRYRVRQAEQLSGSRSGEEWAPFLIARARRQLDQDLEEAARTLSQVGPAARSGVFYWRLQRDLARARGDRARLAAAEEELRALCAREWSALKWRLRGSRASLELLPASAAAGLVLELLPDAPTGAVVEVLWDGEVVVVQPARRGREILLSVAVEPRPHLLEVRTLAGGAVSPVGVRLRGAE